MNNKKYKKRDKSALNIYDFGGVMDKVTSGLSGASALMNSTFDILNSGKEEYKYDLDNYRNLMSQSGSVKSLDDLSNIYTSIQDPNKDILMDGKEQGKHIASQTLTGITTGMSVGGPWGALVGGIVGAGSGIVSSVIGKNKANDRYLESKKMEELAKKSVINNMKGIQYQNSLQAASNYSKFGGPLHTKGGIFDTGLSFIDEGYTHEDNMYGGVPMGVDPEGNPNLVEEGEVVLNSNGQKYVFSNSVYATEDILAQFGLPKKYANASYAYIADKATKEEMETPNDPISKRSLDDKMMRIIQAQEMTKAKQNKNKKKLGNIFKTGGITAPSFDFKLPSKTLAERLYGNKEQFKLEVPDVSELSLIPKEETPIYKASAEDVIPALKRDIYTAPNTKVSKDTSEGSESLARYASIINTGLGLFENRKPDMTGADMIARERAKEVPIGYSPLTHYMTPKPFDRAFYLNKMYGNAAGSRASIRNSAGNRAQALGTLVASDYNTLGAVGDLNRQAEEYNYNNYKDVLDFNRATDIQNLNTAVQANSQRLQQRSLNADLAVKEAALRDAAIAAVGQARSNNRNAFAEDLSNIGRENFIFDMINKNSGLIYQLDKDGSTVLKNASTKKCGGKMLTKKRRK